MDQQPKKKKKGKKKKNKDTVGYEQSYDCMASAEMVWITTSVQG